MLHSLSSFLLLLGRTQGFFLLSPLFSAKGISFFMRAAIALACSLLLLPPILARSELVLPFSLSFLELLIQEVAIGYIIGFILSLLIEAAAFAGQFLASIMGVAGAELFNPIEATSEPLLAKLFAFLAFGLFLLLDAHHLLLRFLYETFTLLPIGVKLSHILATSVLESLTELFHYLLKFSLVPLTFLLPLLIFFSLLGRFFPIFWFGFPIQFIVGALVLSQCALFFLPVIEEGIISFFEILKKNLVF